MRHPFHAMCPYFAMFPEAFAEKWISELSEPGDVVLDPFAGRGTTPFQAILMARVGIGVDINPVAACLNLAKLRAPTRETVLRRLRELQQGYSPQGWQAKTAEMSPFFNLAYDRATLGQLLYLRESLVWRARRADSLLAALVLGALHGEVRSLRYLSNQMPRTISTKPNYSVRFWQQRGLLPPRRDAFEVLRSAVDFRYASGVPSTRGKAYFGDMRNLPREWSGPPASLVVTSPPYGALTSYEEDQWLRLWFLGGPERPSRSRITRDDRRSTLVDYWRFIGDFWRVVGQVLRPDAHVVVRMGASGIDAGELERQLVGSLVMSPRSATVISAKVSEIQRRQTRSFRPGSRGCVYEIDLHVRLH
jgi:DNA methylase